MYFWYTFSYFLSFWVLNIWRHSAVTYNHWRADIFPTILALKFSSWVFTRQWLCGYSIMQILPFTYPRDLNIASAHNLSKVFAWEKNTLDFGNCPHETHSQSSWTPQRLSSETPNASFRDFMWPIFSSHWFPIETMHHASLFLSFRCSWKHFCWALRGKQVL